MARAIPLSSLVGRVYAHACGYCHRVADRNIQHAFLADLAGPLESRLAQSLADAERCCTCAGCGVPIQDLEPVCVVCSWWSMLTGLWLSIGSAINLGIKTEEDWRAYFQLLLDEDGDDNGRASTPALLSVFTAACALVDRDGPLVEADRKRDPLCVAVDAARGMTAAEAIAERMGRDER